MTSTAYPVAVLLEATFTLGAVVDIGPGFASSCRTAWTFPSVSNGRIANLKIPASEPATAGFI